MPKRYLHPYVPPADISATIDRHKDPASPVVHPQRIIEGVRDEKDRFGRFNGWLADHVVGLAGSMMFFYALCLILGCWTFWQSAIMGNTGFDPFPYAFLFFVLGGIMQSLFVPTMLVASNRAAERDRIKDEADHRTQSHLYDVNEAQLAILRELAAKLIDRPPK
jgi:uncharacterized membrane protein